VVGLIPAAGKASRLGFMPSSKELFPVGFENKNGVQLPKTVSSYLLDQMADAGVSSFHFVLRKGKWDIPNYYGGGKQFSKNICYHVADYSYGVPFSINQAYPFIKDKTIAFGFPDILIKPRKVYNQLIEKLKADSNIDIVLGMFPTPDPLSQDKVDVAGSKIKNRYIKTEKAKHLNFTWIIAVWQPSFSRFLNDYLNNLIQIHTKFELLKNECQLSDILILAMENERSIEYIFFENGKCMDIGAPERLIRAEIFLETDL